MFFLWLIVAIVIFAIGMYKLGAADIPEYDRGGMFWVIGLGAFAWPFVVAITIVFGPFVGLYFLGARKRNARKQAEKEAKK